MTTSSMTAPFVMRMITQVYREWTTNMEPILTERPHRASPTLPASNGPFQLLPSPCMGAWPSEILDLLHSRVELPRGIRSLVQGFPHLC